MKNLLLILSLILTSLSGYSQGETNIWYFGDHAGLDFNSGNPVALTDGQMTTSEGCATISNSNGELLFYTDGIKVWNKNHTIMPNGTGLLGDPSSTQSAIIVPKPKSFSIYYIFTTPALGNGGVCYSEIDMTLNNGLGDITSNKNIPLTTPITEKLTAVENATCDGYWVVTHGFQNNSFFAFTVNTTGVNQTPVISNIGETYTTAAGYMKFSPDGKKLVNCGLAEATEIYDFDLLSGAVKNPLKLLKPNDTGSFYGAEFSPSGNVLYITQTNKLFQFDLSASDIPNSKILIYSGNTFLNYVGMGMQLGSNGKIYGRKTIESNFLYAINNPNVLGVDCDFNFNEVSLDTGIGRWGLPQFAQIFLNVVINTQDTCLGSPSAFSLGSNRLVDSVEWDFGDGSTSNEINPVHLYTSPGKYTVTAKAISRCKEVTKSKIVTISGIPVIANIISNQDACTSESVAYDLSQFDNQLLGNQSTLDFGVAYFLSLDDANNHQNILPPHYILPLGATTFYTKVYSLSNPNCYVTTSFSVNATEAPIANKSEDIFVCDDATNDGKEVFNLQNATATILGIQDPNQFNVSFHTSQNDADGNQNSLPFNYTNISNPQTIYARIENKQSINCFGTTSFLIGVNKMPIAYQPQNLYSCDAAKNDEKESFDFTTQIPSVIGNQSGFDFNITFHLSQNDADLNQNSIDNNSAFLNTSNPQIIYVRIENKQALSCFSTTNFQLMVYPKPDLAMNDIYSICEGTNITITAPEGFSTYQWSDGSTGNATTITKTGSYSLTVTKDYQTVTCEATKDFVVYNSNAATITKIETKDWTDNENTISIEVSGDGEYEFSIDGINYQANPVFNDLASGDYTVYVRDKKGCGVTTEEVFLLTYPKFFTPNGDGQHDTWEVAFSYVEPEMIIHIFDRYGKLITVLNNQETNWDGTYNGSPLPSSDYWFVAKRQNGKEYRGHFSLKR